jgi:hypothetical protein
MYTGTVFIDHVMAGTEFEHNGGSCKVNDTGKLDIFMRYSFPKSDKNWMSFKR